MIKYYSKVDPSKLLHMVVRKEDLLPGRVDIVPEEHFTVEAPFCDCHFPIYSNPG